MAQIIFIKKLILIQLRESIGNCYLIQQRNKDAITRWQQTHLTLRISAAQKFYFKYFPASILLFPLSSLDTFILFIGLNEVLRKRYRYRFDLEMKV